MCFPVCMSILCVSITLVGSLELESWMVVSHCVGSGN